MIKYNAACTRLFIWHYGTHAEVDPEKRKSTKKRLFGVKKYNNKTKK